MKKDKSNKTKKSFEDLFKDGPSGWKKHVTVGVIGTVFAFLLYYITLPALNAHSVGFWIYLTVVLAAYILPYTIKFERVGYKGSKSAQSVNIKLQDKLRSGILLGVIALPVAVALIGGLFSSTFFFARRYADVITVEESEFEDDLPETTEITQIALMDSESAEKIGNTALGKLSDVVSQFDIAPNYTQINYLGAPQKVANLEYGGFFKWLNNRAEGIPGMVMVDPAVNNDAEYIKFKTPMKYADSAYFAKDLTRALRFSYPTKIFNSISFEVDEAGNPYFIVSCATARVSLFGAMDIEEVIIFDPTTGKSEICDVKDTPAWIDIVYTGDLACEKYNWQGTLSGGFFNSIIGNKGCKRATDDFGYIALQDDVWYFTGVTSVSNDTSNIGFILSNARTGEYKFYPVIGAEEYSAMLAAEGEVQEKGYVASFPSLINVSGEATYIMVLKDNGGLVKLYALVNVEKYSIVATGETQTAAKEEYLRLLAQNGIVNEEDNLPPEAETLSAEIEVTEIRTVSVNGNSVVYITAADGTLYKQSIATDESVMLIAAGDNLTVEYTNTDIEKIRQIIKWSASNENE